jgi:hypothetical protein
VDYIAE